MKSMTGYGKGEIIDNGRRLSVELRAVNHRFLDLSIKMPKQFIFAEDTLRKALQAEFARGHIDIYVVYEDNSEDKTSLRIDDSVAKNYVDIAKHLHIKYHIADDLTTSALMRLADVIKEDKTEADDKMLMDLLSSALKIAMTSLKNMREKEGEALKWDFEIKIKEIKALLERVEKRAPEVVVSYRDKLRERIKEALNEVEIDESKLICEVAYFTDRANIDEEITRMRSHIAQFIEMIKCDNPIGRKLDFLLQEMNREVNTIGSKANDSELTSIVVDLKTELEKLREQVQNIE